MKILTLLLIQFAFAANIFASPELTKPTVGEDLVFEETGGQVVIEAEHFFKQEEDGVRAWYLTTGDKQVGVEPDHDPNHSASASGAAYLEVLPDTRKNHGEKLIKGENFMNDAGKMAILSYKVYFNTPGKYYVWCRVYPTGTEDNGLHVGIDGSWPESGQRLQFRGKKRWVWDSRQRTEKVHTGVRGLLFLEVEEAGEHTIQFSMREDGFEFDQWMMTTDADFEAPEGDAPMAESKTKSGKAPTASTPEPMKSDSAMTIDDFHDREQVYVDKKKWFAVNPEEHKTGKATGAFPFQDGTYDLTFFAVGENDGQSSYEIFLEGEKIADFKCPLSTEMFEEGEKFSKTIKDVIISSGSMIEVKSKIASKDGKEFSRARWSHIAVKPTDGKKLVRNRGVQRPASASKSKGSFTGDLFGERGEDGDGSIEITGEMKQWHKVTLTLDGIFAHEKDNKPNPFTDMRFDVKFTHESGEPSYSVPGYFAADGNAGETSAESGTKWRAHLSPSKAGKWNYSAVFSESSSKVGASSEGSFTIAPSDKTGRDLRGKGRLEYVGKHRLQFAGDKEWFVKAGADAPETFLAYADFDDTIAMNPGKAPLKTWGPHIKDWKAGDPTWKDGKGKGMIGAINYLSSKGCNAFSFLPYNAGGDGDNVWPFVERDDKFNYDCSKLDQWGIVFDHATEKGMYLHFKLQETENDDNVRKGHKKRVVDEVPESLDGGELGAERMLYCRELVARYGYLLALNWNLGEENTQTTQQQKDMAEYIAALDPYDHLIVVHTYPNQQDKIYPPLMGDASALRGASLQNSNIKDCHRQVVKWNRMSAEKGKPWVVAFDEPGTAGEGEPADEGYPGMPKNFDNPSVHEVRKYALWGTLMANGSGVEYYFGYKLPQNDLLCEDWRSRDQSWDWCGIALKFFRDQKFPLGEMKNEDELVGNNKHDNSAYCLAKKGELYLVYLPDGGERELDLSGDSNSYKVEWFNPRDGSLRKGGHAIGGAKHKLVAPDAENDWLAIVR